MANTLSSTKPIVAGLLTIMCIVISTASRHKRLNDKRSSVKNVLSNNNSGKYSNTSNK